MNKVFEVIISRREIVECKYKCYISAKNSLSAKEKALDGDWNMHEILFRDMNDSSQVHIHQVIEKGQLREAYEFLIKGQL